MKYFATAIIFLISINIGESEAQDRPFVIISEELQPFEYHNQEGEATGINVDLAKMIFDRMELDVEFIIRQEGPRALTRAENGEVDAILSVSYVPDREEFLTYPNGFAQGENYMWISEYVFFVRPDDRQKLLNIDFNEIRDQGLTVGIIEGVSYEPEFWDADLKLLKSSNEEENFQNLIDGNVDLILTDRTLGDASARAMGVRNQLEMLPQSYFSKPYTIGFVSASDHPSLDLIVEEFFSQLDDLRARGIARTIFMQHIRR